MFLDTEKPTAFDKTSVMCNLLLFRYVQRLKLDKISMNRMQKNVLASFDLS